MLRRDFLKTGVIIGGGVLLLHSIPLAQGEMTEPEHKRVGARRYHLHGHARSGCATPPELMPFLEGGCTIHPLR